MKPSKTVVFIIYIYTHDLVMKEFGGSIEKERNQIIQIPKMIYSKLIRHIE